MLVEVMEPLFLLGFPRSGTTWLNKVLREQLSVGLVNEGQFIVSHGQHFEAGQKIEDLEKAIEKVSSSPFFAKMKTIYGISIDWREIVADSEGYDYSRLIKVILLQIARQQGKELIGSKSPGFGRKIDTLTGHFPKSRIIHLIRDGRDCALSHYRMTWGCQNAYVAAVQWQEHFNLVRAGVAQHDGGYLEVRYEDLLARPAMEFERLANFVRGDAEYAADAAQSFASEVGSDAYEKRTGRWKAQMTESDQAIFESVAGRQLAEEGYEVRGVSRSISSSARLRFVMSNRLKREYLHAAKKVSGRIQKLKN